MCWYSMIDDDDDDDDSSSCLFSIYYVPGSVALF